jgi:pilus assembly protein CpaC
VKTIARKAISCLIAGFLASLAVTQLRAQAASAPAAMGQDSANDLSVTVGKTVLIDCAKPVARVAVGLGEFAEASAISPTEIMVNGKTVGETSLVIWDTQGGRQFFNLSVRAAATVSDSGLDMIRRELKTELPGQTLKVSTEGSNIFLRGTVKNLTSSDRAVRIASTAGKVVNLLNVEVPPAEPQIMLKVRFASVDRNKSKQLGLNFWSLGLANTVGGLSTGQFSPPTISDTSQTGALATLPSESQIVVMNPGGLPMGLELEALESKGVVEVLAQPNLLAANGKQASFLAGGEYPYPVVQGGSGGAGASVTIMFKEYGVRLNFIPTITPRGTIRLQVAPEVSSLDFTNAIEISGFNVPAISTRKVKTEVELAAGNSFVLGGLLDNRETETFQKIPFLGDIPVLGRFFQSISRNKSNTELIVIVTPEIVAPIEAGTPLPELKYPVDFLPANSNVPMHNPEAKTGATTPATPTMPIEKLIESMQPETPLVIDSARGGFGGTSTGQATTAAPAPPPQ